VNSLVRARAIVLSLVWVGTALAFPGIKKYWLMEKCLKVGKQWAYGGCYELTDTEFLSVGSNQTWLRAHADAITAALLITAIVAAMFLIRDYARQRRISK
jgi:hypothetical protein